MIKLPSTRGFPASPTLTVCDSIAGIPTKGRPPIAAPEPLDIASFFGLPICPYVRTAAKKLPPPVTLGTWTSASEEKKIPMPFSPPRFKQTKKGPREVTWILHLEIVTLTVTTPLASFAYVSTRKRDKETGRFHSTGKVRRGEQFQPFQTLRADLARLLGETQGAAALAILESEPLPAKAPRKLREITPDERAKWEAKEAALMVAASEASKVRRDRKANPPKAEAAPDFAKMTAKQFAKFNADRRTEYGWIALDESYGPQEVEIVGTPTIDTFPAPFAG
ncbi:MAG: hypothetical protein QOE70_4018 [Chthoniobacter sp.]|jgi:hypothetical protein|nr:hypothetical protein [Chthoniobacter sp.]